MLNMVTLNNQVVSFPRGSITSYAFYLTILTSVIVSHINSLADYIPVFTSKTALIVARTIYIGRIIFACHPFRVLKIEASSCAVFLYGLCSTRKFFTTKRTLSDLGDTINASEQFQAFGFTSAFMRTKSLLAIATVEIFLADFASSRVHVSFLYYFCFKRLVALHDFYLIAL